MNERGIMARVVKNRLDCEHFVMTLVRPARAGPKELKNARLSASLCLTWTTEHMHPRNAYKMHRDGLTSNHHGTDVQHGFVIFRVLFSRPSTPSAAKMGRSCSARLRSRS